MARTDKQLSYEERYQQKMEKYAEVYRIRTEFASKFKLKPEKTKGYYETGDPSAHIPANNNSGSGGGTPAVEVSGNDNVEKVWNFFVSKGFTAAGIAGILGNMKQESGVNPTTIQNKGRGPGTGLIQWENPGRWTQLTTWAQGEGLDIWAIETQLQFLWNEMTAGPGAHPWWKTQVDKYGGIQLYQTTSDYKAAVEAFEYAIEKAGTPNFPNRYKYAEEFLNKYGNGNAGTAASTVGSDSSSQSGSDSTPSARSMSIKFQVARDVKAKGTMDDIIFAQEIRGMTEEEEVDLTVPVKRGVYQARYIPPNVERNGYASSLLNNGMVTKWQGWKPLNPKTFIHLAGPQENLYALEAQVVFPKLRDKLGWETIRVVHGFQPKLEKDITSMHNVGMAMDIYVENIYEAIYVADTAWTMGLRAIAIGGSELDEKNPGFVHIDCGPKAFWPLNHHDVYKGIGTFNIAKG